ncbi:hypothetical protein EDS67_25280 [candidate division KSB1 bacterium]|nr:MAG: hypothetical protein EDS67_25280 [candidate division KSB1 bacterium]MBC6949941.1 hypothetical protein [candidate division KSB1 bacterium]MCE7944611.1 hypothetical protein [Chlorobi bacterium CHB1]MDL1879057.1 hypothetical protein [Cytophagia bacterium CHB2]RIK69102.1 MAG: hypothetical protein DCC62_24010 [candidate division KSB1 bacterium]
MTKQTKIILVLAALITLATLITWQMTGGDYYTKFEVVEQITAPVEQNDPLAAAGFYEGTPRMQTVTRPEFHLGLLPTPRGLFDKHALSVVSIVSPSWFIAIALVLWRRGTARST